MKDGIRVRVEVGLVVTDGCTGGLCSWIGSPAAGGCLKGIPEFVYRYVTIYSFICIDTFAGSSRVYSLYVHGFVKGKGKDRCQVVILFTPA